MARRCHDSKTPPSQANSERRCRAWRLSFLVNGTITISFSASRGFLDNKSRRSKEKLEDAWGAPTLDSANIIKCALLKEVCPEINSQMISNIIVFQAKCLNSDQSIFKWSYYFVISILLFAYNIVATSVLGTLKTLFSKLNLICYVTSNISLK